MQVNYDAGSGITIDGERYELVQFRFSRAERGTRAWPRLLDDHPLGAQECQGRIGGGDGAAKQGKTNAFLKPVFDNFPAKGTTESSVAGATINIADYLPVHMATTPLMVR